MIQAIQIRCGVIQNTATQKQTWPNPRLVLKKLMFQCFILKIEQNHVPASCDHLAYPCVGTDDLRSYHFACIHAPHTNALHHQAHEPHCSVS